MGRANLDMLSPCLRRLLRGLTHGLLRGSCKTLLIATTIGAAAVAAHAKDFNIAPTPAWVNPIKVDWAAQPEQNRVSDGVHYLVSDMQVQIGKSDKVTYRRTVATALNARGVESLGHVEVGFDPSYQTLNLHSVIIHRAGQASSRLIAANVRVLQREKELEYRIFDGTKTANLFLDDLRVGDSVEYAYSLSGTNPAFANRQFGRFDLQWQVPVAHVYRRLIVPTGRQIAIDARNTTLTPRQIDSPASREYIWDVTGMAPMIVESESPGWFDPYAGANWSEFDNWGTVARWAEPMYRVPAQLAPALRREVDRIASATSDPGERLLSALRFVQSEVRYLGVEVGAGSYAPNPPQLVLERRFGDCKDKTMLLLSLLSGLGIEARPALVHTVLRKTIFDESPSPGLFNHVIVRARLAGRDYWLDPTRARQMGTLSTIYQPDYGAALIVDADTKALVMMPVVAPASSRREIKVEFDMRAGYDQPARMTVKSLYKGGAADGVRNMLSSQSRDDLQQRYLNFYARSYPAIQVAEPFTDAVDEAANQVTVTEQYWVREAWKANPDAKRSEFVMQGADMADLLAQPKAPIRKAPLFQQYPADLTLLTEVLLPDDWQIAPESTKVADPAFEFSQTSQASARRFTLTTHFVSLGDEIAAADVPAYAANLKKANNDLGYRLFHREPGSVRGGSAGFGARALPFWIGAAFIGLWVWLAYKVYRHDPPRPIPVPRGTFEMPLNGIGGWLVLVALGIVVGPVAMLYAMRQPLTLFANGSWSAMLSTGSASFDPLLAMLLLFELVTNLGLLIFSLLLAVVFFKRRTNTPSLFIGVTVATVVVQFVDVLLAGAVPSVPDTGAAMWKDFIRAAFGAAIWGTYFVRSRRVRETFVVTLKDHAPMPDAGPDTVPDAVPEPAA